MTCLNFFFFFLYLNFNFITSYVNLLSSFFLFSFENRLISKHNIDISTSYLHQKKKKKREETQISQNWVKFWNEMRRKKKNDTSDLFPIYPIWLFVDNVKRCPYLFGNTIMPNNKYPFCLGKITKEKKVFSISPKVFFFDLIEF